LRRRSKAGLTRYEAISQDDGSSHDCYEEAAPNTTMGLVQRDPSGFWHYLVFKPVLTESLGQKEVARQAAWRRRVLQHLGKDHNAMPMFEASQPEDSARSTLLRPLAQEQALPLDSALKSEVGRECVDVKTGRDVGALQMAANPTSGLKSLANLAAKPGEEPQIRFAAMSLEPDFVLSTEPQEALTGKPGPLHSASLAPQAGTALEHRAGSSADVQLAPPANSQEAPSRDMQLDAHENQGEHQFFIGSPFVSIELRDSSPSAMSGSSNSQSAVTAGEHDSKWPRLRG